MEPAWRSSSTKRNLGLEEEAEVKVGKKWALSDSEEGEGKNLLYVFVSHQGSFDYDYSLFALAIPSHDTIVEIETEISPNTWVKGSMEPISSIIEPERSPVTPVLRFPANEGWPAFMRCIGLGRKLYFLGGKSLGMGPSSTQVHVLDLSQEILDDPRKALKPVASMSTGKSPLIVSFVADGKIFVVCGEKQCRFTGVPFTRFEIFSPEEGVWNVPEHQPPFPHTYYLYPPIVVDHRTVFFAGNTFTCRYHIDIGIWTDYCPLVSFSPSVKDIVGLGGGEVVGETLWNVCDHPKTQMPVVVRLDLAPLMGDGDGGRRPKKKKFFNHILRYCIPDQVDDGDGLFEPAARLVTGLAEDSRRPNSSRLCFLQFEPCNGLVVGEIRISALVFDVHGDDGDRAGSAEYLTSAHFFVPHYETRKKYYKLMDAHLVSLPPLAHNPQ